MALLTGSSAPSNAQGSDGDIYLLIDSAGNKFFYSRVNGTWTGPAATTGPCGPALLSGNGAPASVLGSQGQGYVDLATGTTYTKSSSGWAQVVANAFAGPIGPATLANVALTGSTFVTGPQAGIVTATTTSANTVLPIPGTSVSQVFVPIAGTSFAGFTYLVPSNSGSAVTFNLYDQSAGSVVFSSASVPTGTISTNDKRASAIALTAGNQHVWRVSAGSNVLATVTPYYIVPAYGSIGTGTWPTFAVSTDTAFSGSTVPLRHIGANTTNGPVQYFILPKATYMQSATITVTGSASLTLQLQTGSSVIYTVPVTVSASNSPYTTPLYGSATVPMAAGTSYIWYASGSGTGQAYVNMNYAG